MTGRLAKLDSSSCAYKGGQICSGAVTNEIGKTMIKVCDDGMLKYKSRDLVGDNYPLAGRDTGKGKGNKDKLDCKGNTIHLDFLH